MGLIGGASDGSEDCFSSKWASVSRPRMTLILSDVAVTSYSTFLKKNKTKQNKKKQCFQYPCCLGWDNSFTGTIMQFSHPGCRCGKDPITFVEMMCEIVLLYWLTQSIYTVHSYSVCVAIYCPCISTCLVGVKVLQPFSFHTCTLSADSHGNHELWWCLHTWTSRRRTTGQVQFCGWNSTDPHHTHKKCETTYIIR